MLFGVESQDVVQAVQPARFRWLNFAWFEKVLFDWALSGAMVDLLWHNCGVIYTIAPHFLALSFYCAIFRDQ